MKYAFSNRLRIVFLHLVYDNPAKYFALQITITIILNICNFSI